MLRSLSVRQPWCHLIAHRFKPLENRQNWRFPNFRGEIALHASQSVTRREHENCIDFLVAFSLPGTVPPVGCYPLGAIVALVDIVDFIPPRGDDESYEHALFRCPEPARQWWDQDQGGLIIDRVRLLREPVACKGALGLWTVPPDVEAEVRRQLNLSDPMPEKRLSRLEDGNV